MTPTRAFVVGLALLQALWIVTLPPFAASDEFEHAYRAAGAVRGHLVLDDAAQNGRGQLTEVPAALVTAASAQCDSLRYTGGDTCFGAGATDDGMVLVATAAGSYNPAFYIVIGAASIPFSGAASLYAMRAAAAVLCLALLAAAAWLQRRRGAWTRAGLVLALTPTLVYTMAVGAPNGLEIAAGVTLWVALLELCSADQPEHERASYWMAVASAALLLTLRLLGPVFLAVIVACAAIAGGRRVITRLRSRPHDLVVGGLLLAIVGGLSFVWVMTNGQLAGDPATVPVTSDADRGDRSSSSEGGLSGSAFFSWMLQALAAFPYRNNFVPLPAYVVLGTMIVALVAVATLEGRGRLRLSMWLTLLATMVIPVGLVAATRSSHGELWQGRYILPLGVGFVLLAGRALDEAGKLLPRWLLIGGGGLLSVVMAVGLLVVRDRELDSPASASDPAWWAPPSAAVVVAVLVSHVLLVSSARKASEHAS